MSFVLRVINDAVENSLNSLFEKLNTLLKTFSLKVLEIFAPTLFDKNIITTADDMLISANPSIFRPVINIYFI